MGHLFDSLGDRAPRGYRLPLFALLCACFASAILGDSTAEALLLAHFDATVVARMYLLNALLLFATSMCILPVIDRIDRGALFVWLTIAHGAILFVVWLAVRVGARFLFMPLFSYAYVSKILLFLLFWTLANDLVDSRKAGEDFPFIASGGTLGAIAVSFSIPALLRLVSAQTLLAAWAALSLVLGMMFVPIRRAYGRRFKAGAARGARTGGGLAGIPADLRLVGREPLLRIMAALYFLLFVVILGQQYGFYSVVKERFGQAERIASFLGVFTGISMGATFLLQATAAGRVLRRFGSTRALFAAPATLIVVFAASALAGASPGAGPNAIFWTAVIGVGMRLAVFDSFFSPNFQVFFSSLPRSIRGRGKLTLEGVVKPAAIACASLLLMVAAPRLSFAGLMGVFGGVSVVMAVVTWRLRRVYTTSLTRYLGGLHTAGAGLPDLADIAGDQALIASIGAMLETEPFETQSYLIEILAASETVEAIDLLRGLLGSPDPRLRSRVASALTPLARQECKPAFRSLLADEDPRVAATAVCALAAFHDSEINRGLCAFLKHRAPRVRANTVIALWSDAAVNRGDRLSGVVRAMLHSSDEREQASALYAVGAIDSPRVALSLLKPFFEAHHESLCDRARVWRWFLRAAAHTGAGEALSMMLRFADEARGWRRRALEQEVATLVQAGLGEDAVINRAARAAPRERGIMLNGLCVLRRKGAGLLLSDSQRGRLADIAREEFEGYRRELTVRRALAAGPGGDGAELLGHAVDEECLRRRIDSLIAAASLLDETGSILSSARRLFHRDPHIRARALEVLDNAGNATVNKMAIEALELSDASGREPAHAMRPAEAIDSFAHSDSAWVRRCAAFARDEMSDTAPAAGDPVKADR